MNFYDVNIRNYNFSIRHASKNPTQDLLCSFDGTKASHFLSHRVIFLFKWPKVPFLRFRNVEAENRKINSHGINNFTPHNTSWSCRTKGIDFANLSRDRVTHEYWVDCL